MNTFQKHLKIAEAVSPMSDSRYHGTDHWRRVFDIGVELDTRADLKVLALFAAYHDCMREDDGHDPLHGFRAAEWLNDQDLGLDGQQMETLLFAVRYHNTGRTSDDVTIGTCWDADRLDLPRVGITPDERFMSTPQGKDRCRAMREVEFHAEIF